LDRLVDDLDKVKEPLGLSPDNTNMKINPKEAMQLHFP